MYQKWIANRKQILSYKEGKEFISGVSKIQQVFFFFLNIWPGENTEVSKHFNLYLFSLLSAKKCLLAGLLSFGK